MRRFSRSGESGQAAVETAIILPLFLFTMLGLVQLALMQQARFMTKYAAYKAVRAGSINRGKLDVMEKAAIAVLVPMITRSGDMGGSGDGQKQYGVYSVLGGKYGAAFNDVAVARNNERDGKKLVEVTVCHPTKTDNPTENTDFDDPKNNPMGGNANWRPFEKTKLAAQVTFYYHLIIPFANAVLWNISFGQENLELMQVMRFHKHQGAARKTRDELGWTLQELKAMADSGIYIMPVRASYAMRMMSNFSPSANLPQQNKCRIAWRPLHRT